MQDHEKVVIELGGEALETLSEWKERRDRIHQQRLELSDRLGADGSIARGPNLTGWVFEGDEAPADHFRSIDDTVIIDGVARNIFVPNKRYNEGKALAAEKDDLSMPSRGEVFEAAGLQSYYEIGNKWIQPGLTEVGGMAYVTGIPDQVFNGDQLKEGCRVLKQWEYLKIVDEAQQNPEDTQEAS